MTRGRDKVKKYQKVINIFCRFYSILPKKILNILLEKNRKKTGKIGMLKRYCILKNLAKHIGTNVSIHPNVYLFNVEQLSIGDNVSIHPMSYIEAYGGIKIGNDVSIAHSVTILSVSHLFDDLDTPIKDQGLAKQPVEIKNNVWIGAKATILGGITIEPGSIVGGSALVNKNVEKNTIVAGIPAKIIKKRA